MSFQASSFTMLPYSSQTPLPLLTIATPQLENAVETESSNATLFEIRKETNWNPFFWHRNDDQLFFWTLLLLYCWNETEWRSRGSQHESYFSKPVINRLCCVPGLIDDSIKKKKMKKGVTNHRQGGDDQSKWRRGRPIIVIYVGPCKSDKKLRNMKQQSEWIYRLCCQWQWQWQWQCYDGRIIP